MPQSDLAGYSKQELLDLKDLIDRELEQRRRAQLKEAQNEIEDVAERYGVALADLLTGIVGEPEGESEAVYRHPQDPTKRWAGRGRRPKWIKEWQARGGSLDQLRR